MLNRIVCAGVFFLSGAVFSEELVISGVVRQTSTTTANDMPIPHSIVKVVGPAGGNPLISGLSQLDGRFKLVVPDRSVLKGKETVIIEAAGYTKSPMERPLKLAPTPSEKVADQGVFLLTDAKAMRESAEYRAVVAGNAVKALSTPGQEGLARDIFASIASLPVESKGAAFDSVKVLDATAYSELLRINKDSERASKFAAELMQKDFSVVPSYDPAGKLRITGPVNSQHQMDDILKQANQKGFDRSAVINHMHIRKD